MYYVIIERDRTKVIGGNMKLFVTDLDGTLLSSDHTCSDYNMETLKKASSMGVKICIASGRSYGDIIKLIKGYDLNPYIISSNGASAYDDKGNKIHSVSIPKNEVVQILQYLDSKNLQYEASTDEYTYATQDGLNLLHKELEDVGESDTVKKNKLYNDIIGLVLSQKNLKIVPTLEDLLNEVDSVNSISSLSAYLHKIKNAKRHFTMDSRLSTFSSVKYNFELTSSKTSKGVALTKLADSLNIPLKNVAAIGDNYNDISMLKVAGYKGAMANAVPNVISLAEYIAPSNDENGVAEFLESLL